MITAVITRHAIVKSSSRSGSDSRPFGYLARWLQHSQLGAISRHSGESGWQGSNIANPCQQSTSGLIPRQTVGRGKASVPSILPLGVARAPVSTTKRSVGISVSVRTTRVAFYEVPPAVTAAFTAASNSAREFIAAQRERVQTRAVEA